MPKAGTQGRLVAVIATVVLVAACSGNPEPTVESKSPDPKTSPTSASPTPTPPSPSATPGEAPERTFVRHYIDLQNYAESTGDTGPMMAASSPECQSCTGAADVVKKVYTAGGHYEGDHEVTIDWIEGSGTNISVGTRFGAYQVVASPGAKPKSYKPQKYVYDFRLQHKGDQWIVREISVSDA